MPNISLIRPVVSVDGSPISEAVSKALVSVEVDRSVNLVGRTTLRFVEPSFDLEAQPVFKLGARVQIKLSTGAVVFQGEVTGFSVDQETEGAAGTTLTITVDDAAHKLGRNSQHQAFLNQTYSDALTSLFAAEGVSSSIVSLSPAEEYILQSGTPLAFLDWVCTRFGLLWWVEDDKVTVVKAGTSSATVPLKLGEDLIRLSTRASDRHPGKVTVTGWDTKQQVQVTSTASTTTTAESQLVTKFPGRAAATGSGISVAGRALTSNEAEKVSASLLTQATAAAVTTRGTAWITPALKPGTTVDISNAGTASGKFFVSRVQHSYNASGFYTRFTGGPLQPESIVDLLGTPPPSGGAVAGTLLTAVVTNNKDDDNLGRVKVKYPTLGSGVESQWARIVTLGGGPGRGAVFHPEVNDEVLVGFEDGDTRRPVVLGGLYSEKNTLPSTDNVNQGKVNYRRITSRVGHIIELYDGDNDAEQYVQLKTKKGHYIKVAEDKLELKVANKPVSITNGPAKIEFSDQGDITIEGENITIKAKQAVKVEGTSEATVKSNATAKLQGIQVEVKGSASGTIDGGGTLGIKGGTVAIN